MKNKFQLIGVALGAQLIFSCGVKGPPLPPKQMLPISGKPELKLDNKKKSQNETKEEK